jgi:cysteine-rich repeat protein
MSLKNNTKGSSLAISVGLIVLLVLASAAVNELIIRNLKAVQKIEASNRAFYSAEAALEDAFYELTVQEPGYETSDRTSNFGGTNTNWTAKWSIEGMNTAIDNKLKGQILPYQKVVIPLYKVIDAPSTADINKISENPGTAVKKFNINSITFSLPEAPQNIAVAGLEINNDQDNALNEDGSPDNQSGPHDCNNNGKTYSAKDDDCDNQENEDSKTDPVISWRIIDEGDASQAPSIFSPKKGCINDYTDIIPDNQGDQICEGDFSTSGTITLLGGSNAITEIGAFISTAKRPKLEFSIIAPLINSLNPPLVNPTLIYDHLNYEIDSTENIPTPYYTLKVDGKYNDYVQSITTTLLPQTTSPLLDFTIVQQSTASTFSERELSDLFTTNSATTPSGSSTGGGAAGGPGGSTSGGTPTACTLNGTLDPGEQCDDGNTISGDGCSATCATENGWLCIDAGAGSCNPICGDGIKAGIETCDDNNAITETCPYGVMIPCTVCNSTCQNATGTTAFCGDSITNISDGEQCDDGNATANDGCSATCQTEPPIANNDTATVINKYSTIPSAANTVIIDLFANDKNADGTSINPSNAILQTIPVPSHGSLIAVGGAGNNGKYRYNPDDDFEGTDSFTYQFTYAGQLSSIGTVAVTVKLPAIAFVTNNRYLESWSGLTGGDTICNNEARMSGSVIPNNKNFVAWLSSTSLDAKDRIKNLTDVPYILTNGAIIANNSADLLDGTLATALNVDFRGSTLGGCPGNDFYCDRVWTGTLASGIKTTNRCADWTNGGSGVYGYRRSSNFSWSTELANGSTAILCAPNQGVQQHLYCFEAPVTAPVANNDGPFTGIGNQNAVKTAITAVSFPTSTTTINVSDLLLNDTTTNGLDTNSFVATSPSNGTLIKTGNTLTYTPNNLFQGTDTFTYTVKDNSGKISNPATVSLDIKMPKLVFVTNTVYPDGALGGFAGADAKCQAEADAGGIGTAIGKTFKAFLSGDGGSGSPNHVTARLNNNQKPHVRTDGLLVANTFLEFFANSSNIIAISGGAPILNNPINTTQFGTLAGGSREVFTGNLISGNNAPVSYSKTCSNFTSNQLDVNNKFLFGYRDEKTCYWTNVGVSHGDCDNASVSGKFCGGGGNFSNGHLYCFEQ